jgi:uncharacterized protein (TIGR03067 family)
MSMATLLSQADSLKDLLALKHLHTLQGAWEFVTGTREARLVITGHHFLITFKNGDEYLGSFALDPTSRPKAIDLVIDEGPERHKGKESRGIYLLDNDHLLLCPGIPGSGERPEVFPEPEDRSRLHLVFRKNKNAARA